MRISDWSSDVCSSDLRLAQRPEVGKAAGKAVPGRRWRQYVGLLCHGSSIGNVRRVQQVQFPVTLSVLAFHATGTILTAYTIRTVKRSKSGHTVEIGRAECRERVWQSVKISVAGVTLKKKKRR